MDKIKMSVPLDSEILFETSDYFRKVAEIYVRKEAKMATNVMDYPVAKTPETTKSEFPEETPPPPVEEISESFLPSEETPPPPAFPGSVELANGVPWDHRVHSSGETKYLKKPFDWKRKRGVSDQEFDRVIAELKAAVAVPGPDPGEVPADVTMVANFAELNAAVTAAKKNQEEISAALQVVGIATYPLLAVRADLIQQFATALFKVK